MNDRATDPVEMGLSPELSPVFVVFGQWAATEFGIERIDGGYAIEVARLPESDWVRHIRRKRSDWDVFNFARALREARRIHGIGGERRRR